MKKVMRIMLPLMLVFALMLSACSSNSGSNSNAGSTNGSTNGSTSGSTSSNSGDSKSEKPVELVMAFLNLGNLTDLHMVNEEINKITLEKINATVKLMPIDSAAWVQQINLLLAGSEPLDLVVTSAFFNYSSQVTKGQLIPLDDLLDEHAPGIRDVIPPAILAGTKINGVTYGVPSVREFASDYGYIARKDIIEKYNIDLAAVKTFKDLTPIFALLKENEPDMYPLVQRDSGNTLVNDMLAGYIDSLGDGVGALYYEGDDTTLFNQFETEMYREAAKVAREWYQAGYVPADSATTQETNVSYMQADKAVGYLANFKPGFENQEKVLTGHELVSVRITDIISSSSAASAFMMSIAKNSKHPDKAMQLMNLLYTDKDIVNLLDNGVEGVHYVQVGDGTIKIPDGVTDQTYLGTQWLMGNNSLAYPWEGTDPDIWDQMNEFNDSARYSKAGGFVFDATNVKTEVASIQNVLDEFRPAIETGTVDPSTIDDFNQKLKAAGVDRMIEEKQAQLDAWLETK